VTENLGIKHGISFTNYTYNFGDKTRDDHVRTQIHFSVREDVAGSYI